MKKEKRHFPCLTSWDGKIYFLESPLTRLKTTGHREVYSTPNELVKWKEVKEGDTIIEYNEAGFPIASHDVFEITPTYIIASNESDYKEFYRMFGVENLAELYELEILDEPDDE